MIRFIALIAITISAAAATSGCENAARDANYDKAAVRHVLWQVGGQDNTVYLLGSVHLLRDEDYPLPMVYEAVYEDAEFLVMELDMDDLDPRVVQQQMMSAGMVNEGNSLRRILGDAVYREASAVASTIDVELEMLNALEPWLAALTVVELQMAKLGFDSALGVENHFLTQALADHKPIQGFETIEQQVAIFDNLPIDEQSRFLLKTLEDAQTIEEGLDLLIRAWRDGDLQTLHDELIKGFDGFPAVYDSLVVRRNEAWTDEIEQFLDDDDDYLVIVGALHLIGKDSVIMQLRDKGYRIDQL